jgi:predicted flavoprotein YhiN
VKADAALRLTGAAAGESRGEVLFTEKGVSGPAVFDISRAVSTAPTAKRSCIWISCGTFQTEQTAELLRRRIKNAPELPAEELFTGVLHNRLGRMAVKYAGISGTKRLCELADAEISAAAESCRDFTIADKRARRASTRPR